MYALLVFFHVIAAMGLAAALAFEGVSIHRLGAAPSYEEGRAWSGLWRLLMAIGIPSTLLVLGSGIYLASASAAWKQAWVQLAVPILVVIAVAGSLLATRRNRIQSALTSGVGPLPEGLRSQLGDGFFQVSWRFRALLLACLVLEMTTRPDGPEAFWELGAAVALGVLWGAPRWKTLSPRAPRR